MARSFRQVAPDRIEIREGGGCLSLFGLPFLAAGIFVSLAAAGIVPMANADNSPASWTLLLFLGVTFTIVGGALVFGRAWTAVDSSRRVMTKEWGLLWPMRGQSQAIDNVAAVMIGFESGDSDSADQFPIFLRSNDGSCLKLCSFTEYGQSRACATAVGGQLHVDLEDATTDHVQRMAASQAGVSLGERSRRDDRRDDRAAPPPTVRSTIDYDGDTTRIDIPKPRVHPFAFLFMLLPPAVAFLLFAPLSDFFSRTNTPDPVGWIFLGFLLFGFGVLPAGSAVNAWLRSRLGRTIVTTSSEGITIQDRGIWTTRSQATIARSDILDVDYSTRTSTIDAARRATEQRVLADARSFSAPAPSIGPRTEGLIAFVSRFAKGRGIIVKTRQGLTTFGEGLADDEIEYLHGIVRRALLP